MSSDQEKSQSKPHGKRKHPDKGADDAQPPLDDLTFDLAPAEEYVELPAKISEKQPQAPVESDEAQAPDTPTGFRIWLLPTTQDKTWAVAEPSEVDALAEGLQHQPPLLITARSGKKQSLIQTAAAQIDNALKSRTYEAVFEFARRALVAAGWILVVFVGLRLPGVLKDIDAFMLVGGVAYFIYACGRYGREAIRWHNRRVDAGQTSRRAHLRRSAFVDRLADALRLRKTLNHQDRGQSPDDELLDTNAYRKLIQEKLISREELVALGKSVGTQLGLNEPGREDRKPSEIAAELGLDVESVIFYRDLSHAAKDIELSADELNT